MDAREAARLEDRPYGAVGSLAQPPDVIAPQTFLPGPRAWRLPAFQPRHAQRSTYPESALLVPPDAPDQVGWQALCFGPGFPFPDRKSTRLNSSHRCISYA